MNISNVLPSRESGFTARDWRPYEKNTLRGFVSIETPTGLILHEVSVHEKEGKRWIGMPSKQWTKSDGTVSYKPQVEFRDAQIRDRFQRMVLEAIDKLLRQSV